eukprot:Em0003g1159a
MVQQYRTSDVTLVPGQKICSGCRIKLIQRQIPLNSIDEVDMGTSWEPRSSGSDDGDERDLSTDLSSLLVSLGQSPIDRTKLGRKRYCEDKVKENEQGIRKKLKLEPSKEEQEYQELLEQLKKFGDSSTRSEKLQVLVSFLSPGQYKELKRSLGQLFTWQGCKVIFNSESIKEMLNVSEDTQVTYKHFLAKLSGNPPQPICFLGECNLCKSSSTEAEWHFFATSHGKGPCNGLGGTVKHLATKASLPRAFEDQIQSAIELYEWAKGAIPSIHFQYVTTADYEAEEILLRKQLESAITIVGTHSFHVYYPMHDKTNKLEVKVYSCCPASEIVRVSSNRDLLAMEDIHGYIICAYDSRWWLALVMEKYNAQEELKVRIFHPAGPSPSFSFPRRLDELVTNRAQV